MTQTHDTSGLSVALFEVLGRHPSADEIQSSIRALLPRLRYQGARKGFSDLEVLREVRHTFRRNHKTLMAVLATPQKD